MAPGSGAVSNEPLPLLQGPRSAEPQNQWRILSEEIKL